MSDIPKVKLVNRDHKVLYFLYPSMIFIILQQKKVIETIVYYLKLSAMIDMLRINGGANKVNNNFL